MSSSNALSQKAVNTSAEFTPVPLTKKASTSSFRRTTSSGTFARSNSSAPGSGSSIGAGTGTTGSTPNGLIYDKPLPTVPISGVMGGTNSNANNNNNNSSSGNANGGALTPNSRRASGAEEGATTPRLTRGGSFNNGSSNSLASIAASAAKNHNAEKQRSPVPEGKTRICVAGFKQGKMTGHVHRLAALIAEKLGDHFETWYYFDEIPQYFSFIKAEFSNVPFPPALPQDAVTSTAAPFVWTEKRCPASFPESVPSRKGANLIVTLIGGGSRFQEYVANTLTLHNNDRAIQDLAAAPAADSELDHVAQFAPQTAEPGTNAAPAAAANNDPPKTARTSSFSATSTATNSTTSTANNTPSKVGLPPRPTSAGAGTTGAVDGPATPTGSRTPRTSRTTSGSKLFGDDADTNKDNDLGGLKKVTSFTRSATTSNSDLNGNSNNNKSSNDLKRSNSSFSASKSGGGFSSSAATDDNTTNTNTNFGGGIRSTSSSNALRKTTSFSSSAATDDNNNNNNIGSSNSSNALKKTASFSSQPSLQKSSSSSSLQKTSSSGSLLKKTASGKLLKDGGGEGKGEKKSTVKYDRPTLPNGLQLFPGKAIIGTTSNGGIGTGTVMPAKSAKAPPREVVPEGKTRICVAGVANGKVTTHEQKLAALIAERLPNDYETWSYVDEAASYYAFVKSEFANVPFPPALPQENVTSTAAPFVWTEKRCPASFPESLPSRKGPNLIVTLIGGGSRFQEYVNNTLTVHNNDEEIQKVASTVMTADAE